ncbi:MAG: hypothetical protein U1F81_20705 [Verrucomicrobiaceae bacterium]
MSRNEPRPRMRPSIHGPVRRATAKPGRLKSYRLRVAWEREWPRDPRYEAKCAARARRSRQWERLFLGSMLLGAVVGAAFAAWQGYHLYGPNGIPAGLLLGSLGGAVAGLLSLGLLVLFILAGVAALGMLVLGS